MAGTIVLGNKTCRSRIECAHHIKYNAVCIDSCRVPFDNDVVKGIDRTLDKQVGDCKQRILDCRRNTDAQYLHCDMPVQPDQFKIQPVFSFTVEQMLQDQCR